MHKEVTFLLVFWLRDPAVGTRMAETHRFCVGQDIRLP